MRLALFTPLCWFAYPTATRLLRIPTSHPARSPCMLVETKSLRDKANMTAVPSQPSHDSYSGAHSWLLGSLCNAFGWNWNNFVTYFPRNLQIKEQPKLLKIKLRTRFLQMSCPALNVLLRKPQASSRFEAVRSHMISEEMSSTATFMSGSRLNVQPLLSKGITRHHSLLDSLSNSSMTWLIS